MSDTPLSAATIPWNGNGQAAHDATTPPRARTLADVHQTFRHWFGEAYDLDAINVVLATAAAERLDGDALWVMLISGSGNTKTETVSALSGTKAIITSTISSDGALLSASPTRERAKDATGGLLRRLGSSGVLVIKDMTSILSMDRNTRSTLIAAFREIHDGHWERNVSVEGGRSLRWDGRLAVIAACTTAWDRAHDVIASMGDRFVVLRMDSSNSHGRILAGYKAMANTGSEVTMRAALADAVTGALRHIDPRAACPPRPDETEALLTAADVVTLVRTGVDYDYRGAVIDAHAEEMPTRFAKQLVQVMRGACAVGLDRTEALRLALRCARDSMPPLRLAILEDVAAHPQSRTRDIRQRVNKPYTTVDRQLQALHILGVLDCDEVVLDGQAKSSWLYAVNPRINLEAISNSRFVTTQTEELKKKGDPSHISGTREQQPDHAGGSLTDKRQDEGDARFRGGWQH